jgi:hypothetical protein
MGRRSTGSASFTAGPRRSHRGSAANAGRRGACGSRARRGTPRVIGLQQPQPVPLQAVRRYLAAGCGIAS